MWEMCKTVRLKINRGKIKTINQFNATNSLSDGRNFYTKITITERMVSRMVSKGGHCNKSSGAETTDVAEMATMEQQQRRKKWLIYQPLADDLSFGDRVPTRGHVEQVEF